MRDLCVQRSSFDDDEFCFYLTVRCFLTTTSHKNVQKKIFFLVVGRAGGRSPGGAGGGGGQQYEAVGGVGPGAGGGLQLLVMVHSLHHPGGGSLAVPVGVGRVGGSLPPVTQTGPFRQVICNITSSLL